jgi:hypothetical protein
VLRKNDVREFFFGGFAARLAIRHRHQQLMPECKDLEV